MKLYLAVATLMLVLIAHSEAQEESTIEQQFANFQARVKEFGDDVTEKTKYALQQIEESEFVSKTKNWLTEQLEKIRQKFDEGIKSE